MEQVPTVSLARFEGGVADTEEWQALDLACRDHGFFLLTDHGAEAKIDAMWSAAGEFFSAPRAVKHSVMRDADNPLGYYDRELTKQKRDLKEVFDFKCGGHQSRNPARQSRWPDDMEQFRQTLDDYFQTCTDLARRTAVVVFQAMGLSRQEAVALEEQSFGSQHTSVARLNCYPSVDPLNTEEQASVNALGDMALHHHTDPGGVTLLLQDQVGGLQALSSADGWIDVPPAADAFVVNLGDVMQVWTNDRYKAAVHRVLPMTNGRTRYSTPFFYQPRFDAEIAPRALDGVNASYRSFTWREFIRGRVTDNFADYGSDDIQISRYRLSAAS